MHQGLRYGKKNSFVAEVTFNFEYIAHLFLVFLLLTLNGKIFAEQHAYIILFTFHENHQFHTLSFEDRKPNIDHG